MVHDRLHSDVRHPGGEQVVPEKAPWVGARPHCRTAGHLSFELRIGGGAECSPVAVQKHDATTRSQDSDHLVNGQLWLRKLLQNAFAANRIELVVVEREVRRARPPQRSRPTRPHSPASGTRRASCRSRPRRQTGQHPLPVPGPKARNPDHTPRRGERRTAGAVRTTRAVPELQSIGPWHPSQPAADPHLHCGPHL